MSPDLQATQPPVVFNPAIARQQAIYLDAKRSDRRVHKPRNVADLLERGHRGKPATISGQLVDVTA
jgi:hypothetical protein